MNNESRTKTNYVSYYRLIILIWEICPQIVSRYHSNVIADFGLYPSHYKCEITQIKLCVYLALMDFWAVTCDMNIILIFFGKLAVNTQHFEPIDAFPCMTSSPPSHSLLPRTQKKLEFSQFVFSARFHTGKFFRRIAINFSNLACIYSVMAPTHMGK